MGISQSIFSSISYCGGIISIFISTIAIVIFITSIVLNTPTNDNLILFIAERYLINIRTYRPIRQRFNPPSIGIIAILSTFQNSILHTTSRNKIIGIITQPHCSGIFAYNLCMAQRPSKSNPTCWSNIILI